MEAIQISSFDKKKDLFAQLSTDPNNKFWSSDKTRFGFKMLQKMGWSEGKGLGKNEQGMSTHVKATKIEEKSGLGEKEDSADWKINNFNYNKLLSDLSAKYAPKPITGESDSSSSESESEKEEKPKKKKKVEAPTPSIETSKSPKPEDKIIFTRRLKAKQVSKYSKDDMKAILGIKESSSKDSTQGTEFVSDIPVIVHKETIKEYFEKKLDRETETAEELKEEKKEKESKKQKKEKKLKKEKKSKKRESKESKEEKEESDEMEPEQVVKSDAKIKKQKKRARDAEEEVVEEVQKVRKEKKEKKEKKRKHVKENGSDE